MTNRIFSFAFCVAALSTVLLAAGCQDVSTELAPPTYKTGIPDTELRFTPFKKEFPREYASYMKNNEDTVMTEYKGSVPFHKNDGVNPLPKGFKHAQPYLKRL